MMTDRDCRAAIDTILHAVAECREALLWAQDDPEPLRTENIAAELAKRDAAIRAGIQSIIDRHVRKALDAHTQLDALAVDPVSAGLSAQATDTATSEHGTEPSDAA